MLKGLKQRSILPGFGISMGFTMLYLSLIVLIPLSAILFKTMNLSLGDFWKIVTDERVVASYKLSFGASLAGALINMVFGFIIAWVLVRYTFPGKRIVDALVDLPFALPTAVAGIALTQIYSVNGWIGKLVEPLGLKIAYTPLGIIIALTFIGLPFVVRTVQPILQELDKEVEEAAVSLGAKRWKIFIRIILPEIMPALITGTAIAFARGLGEYGSVVFISGNMPFKTEIAPLLIMTKLEQFDYTGATAIALVMLIFSFAMMLIVNLLQWRSNRKVSTV
jgi:sulfate transport system permease protein